MKISHLFLFVGFFLAGCANTTAYNAAEIANRQAQQDGSPFRWKVEPVKGGGALMFREMIPLPSGPTNAGPLLKADTLELLKQSENAEERSDVAVEDIKLLPDGREVWVLEDNGGGLAYIVQYQPADQGGTDIEINGPVRYRK